MPTIGVAIITKNAEQHLEKALNSIQWADEIVILDSGSTDNTLQIAKKYSVHVFQSTDWPGFGKQKNRAIGHLNTDWIFTLDADEVISSELETSIKQAINSSLANVFSVSRRSNYCGRWMHHSGWYPDYIPRLFKKNSAIYSDDLVHERLLFTENAPVLAGELLHYSFDSLDQVLDKINRYSQAGAQQKYAKGEDSSLFKAIYKGVWAFIRTYLLKRGFLDGKEGFILAISNAEGTYYRYLKLMYLRKNLNQ